LPVHEHRQQLLVLPCADPAVDPVGTQHLDRVPYAFWAAGLPGVNRSLQPGRARPAKRFSEPRTGAPRSIFVPIDRQGVHPGVADLDQPVHHFEGICRGHVTKQADAQPDRRQAVLLGLGEAGVKALDESS